MEQRQHFQYEPLAHEQTFQQLPQSTQLPSYPPRISTPVEPKGKGRES